MAVISLTITPSSRQVVAGIPETVSITTNVPAMIFYTTDGTTPNLESSVYTEPIILPTDQPSANLQAFATNGTDSSSVINITYSPNITNSRLPHSVCTKINQISRPAPGVRGDNPKYLYSQPASYTVDAANVIDTYFDGYGADPSIYPVISLDAQPPSYLVKKSETDFEGRIGDGIGTLPKVSILYIPPPPDRSDVNEGNYNSKAKVIYHDSRVENENSHEIFRQFFDSENFEKAYYGSKYTNSATLEGDCLPSGTFLNYYYNPKDNTVTFCYMDSRTCQWIFSKEEMKSPSQDSRPRYDSSNISSNTGDFHVYRWMLFGRTGII